MHYEKQHPSDTRWAIGTGWLIRPDLIVTAGHCSYDWEHAFGRCFQVKAYVGYNGAASVKTANVQFRRGKKIVTTVGWLKGGANRANDVSFIEVDKPFTGITPFQFIETPMSGNTYLGVVGYPGDKRFNNQELGEQGAQMYEEFDNVTWNLDQSARHMLEYNISTYAGTLKSSSASLILIQPTGQSGSPVLRKSDLKPISVHVYGGAGKNSASVINGMYGNPFNSYVSVFDKQYPAQQVAASVPDLSFVSVPSQAQDSKSLTVDEPGAEDFWSTLKSVIKVAAPIASDVLQVGSIALGPVAGPIAAIAGTALGAAGKLAGAESDLGGATSDNAVISRAILAEAAMSVVENMDQNTAAKLGIYQNMQAVYSGMGPKVKDLAPKILPTIREPALRIALDNLQKRTSGTESDFLSTGIPERLQVNTGDLSTSDAFAHKLLEPTVRETAEESFWSSLGGMLKTAGTVAGVATSAINSLSSMVSPTESGIELSELDKHLIALANRAIMGECALQALQKVDSRSLGSESFFGALKSIVQKVGPVVVKVAPAVIQAVPPVIKTIVTGSQSGSGGGGGGGDESSWASTNTESLQPPVPLSPKKSLEDLVLSGDTPGK